MIRWERDGAIATAVLDRPERRNALTAAACGVLVEHLATTGDARVVIIAGANETFCSGADLAARLDETEHGAPDAFRPAFAALTHAMAESPCIIVAAVDGPALGAGTQLAAWSDLRVAGDTAMFGIPAGHLGVHVAGSSIARLVDVVGMSAAERLLLSSETIDADAAFRIGLAQYRAAAAPEAARTLAERLVALAPRTLAGHKLALRALRGNMSAADVAAVGASEDEAFASADFREGLAARRERRRPRFTGA